MVLSKRKKVLTRREYEEEHEYNIGINDLNDRDRYSYGN